MLRLALRLLIHDRLKLIVAAAGVSVSVLLVLTQLGVYLGFLSTASMLFDHSTADLWVTSKGTRNFDDSQQVDDRTFYRVLDAPGVARAERVAFGFADFRLKSGGKQSVEVVGLEARAKLLTPWNLVSGTSDVHGDADAGIVDRSELRKLELAGVGDDAEIGGLRMRVVGLSEGIRTFTTAPFVFTDLRRARRHLSWGTNQATFVALKVASSSSVPEVLRQLALIPGVTVYTPTQISTKAQKYWAKRTGVGISFFSMAIMAVIVGFVVVGQILYNNTLQNVREYATLKAMGARNSAVLSLVFAQAAITALLGLALGGALAFTARAALLAANLVVVFSTPLLLGTALLTLLMCLFAALMPALKLLRLDPTTVLSG